jgi:hypothetical protein
VDKFNDMFVSGYVTGGYIKFLLLHDGKSEDSIRQFFTDLHDLYLRVRACSRVMISLRADRVSNQSHRSK